MTYEYKNQKIVCIIREDLETWQAMNIIGHLAIRLGADKDDELMGRDVLIDASGIAHRGIARYGLIIKKGSPIDIRKALETCRENQTITVLDFPREMLETSHDDELANSILIKNEKDFEYLGILLYGPTNDIHTLTKSFPLWS